MILGFVLSIVYRPTTASACASNEGSGTTGTVADSLSAAGSAISNVLGNLFGGNDAPAPAPSASDISGLASPGSQGTASTVFQPALSLHIAMMQCKALCFRGGAFDDTYYPK